MSSWNDVNNSHCWAGNKIGCSGLDRKKENLEIAVIIFSLQSERPIHFFGISFL